MAEGPGLLRADGEVPGEVAGEPGGHERLEGRVHVDEEDCGAGRAGRAAQGLVAQDHPGEVFGRAAVLVQPGEHGWGAEVLRRAGACLAEDGGEALQRLPGGHGHAGQPQQPQGCAAEHAGQPGVGGVLVEAALGGQGQAREAELRRDVHAAAYPGSRSCVSW